MDSKGTPAAATKPLDMSSAVDWENISNASVLDASTIAQAVQKAEQPTDIPYTTEVRYFDFSSYGKDFTQVAIVITPETPLMINGRRVVIATSEGGSDNGRGFIADNEGNEGIGPWLARRGVTFIQLCRIGRWNFLTQEPLGSWRDVPLSTRMPVFNRKQSAHWPADDYSSVAADGVSSPTNSQACRIPRKGSELEEYMIALAPMTSIRGFNLALTEILPASTRDKCLVLFNGFSTGGAFMWALARMYQPDGVVGYGMSSLPIAYYSSRSKQSKFDWLYDKSAGRLRERGVRDFEYFNGNLAADERDRLWQEALHHPRFKSHEDTFMFFNVAALSEGVSRLWNSSFLPAEDRKRGLAALIKENLDLCFPDSSLSSLSAVDLYGTQDEILTPQVAQSVAEVMGPYCGKYRMVFLDGFHHSIISNHAQAYGSLWLDAIKAGYFST